MRTRLRSEGVSTKHDSDLGRAIAVHARAQQDSLWNRQQLANQLRSLLREYYPAVLAAFATWTNGLCRPEASELLKTAPTPTRAARLTRTQIQAALKRAGRQRRFADARGLKAYASSSPIPRASGKKSAITRRWVKNDRLNHAGYLWALTSLRHPPGPTPITGADANKATGTQPHSATSSTA
ncbi:transposase [Streptomyces sp. NPDC059875]|uniref:transposase n=1 Tax=unclassified Streptomyces TaxID=2593676 RepID=UPI00364EA274